MPVSPEEIEFCESRPRAPPPNPPARGRALALEPLSTFVLRRLGVGRTRSVSHGEKTDRSISTRRSDPCRSRIRKICHWAALRFRGTGHSASSLKGCTFYVGAACVTLWMPHLTLVTGSRA